MDNLYKIGTNFDSALVDGIKEINQKYTGDDRVSEVYGSIREHSWLTARPDFRLPDVSLEELEAHVASWRAIDVDFNYTLNTISVGSKIETLELKDKIKDLVEYLEAIGVKRITVADMLLLDIIRNYCKSDISIEISTIAHVDTVSQLKYLRDEYNVDKVCNNLLKNRSIKFLKGAVDYCNKSGLVLELMVNEFCSSSTGDDTSTHCLFRDSCYKCHAGNITKKDAQEYKLYPMGKCMSGRNQSPGIWLTTKFVSPNDIWRYNILGINNWKITGRTGTTEYILATTEHYLKQQYSGNILGLWKPLDTIYSEQPELEKKHKFEVDASKMSRFMDKWFSNPNFDCANELCGETCRYCYDYYERM